MPVTARLNLRKRKSNVEKEEIRNRKFARKRDVIHNDFSNNKVKSFEDIYAVMSETALAHELRISFYTFRKKVYDPNEFTRGDMSRIADLFNVPIQAVFDFLNRMIEEKEKQRLKKKRFKDRQS